MSAIKKSTVLSYIAIVVVLILWGIMFVNNKRLQDINQTLKAAVSNTNTTNTLISKAYLESVLYGGRVNIVSELKGLDDRVYNLEEIINAPTLVFAFTESSCNPCVEREMKNIKKLEDVGVSILIVGKYSSYRGLISLLSDYEINSNRIAISRDEQIFNIDDECYIDMCYAVVDKGNKIDNFFIPVQHADELSESYINIIEHIFKVNYKN